MADKKLRLTQATINGMKYQTRYAVAQVPTHKNEDTWAVYDGSTHDFGTMADAVFMVRFYPRWRPSSRISAVGIILLRSY